VADGICAFDGELDMIAAATLETCFTELRGPLSLDLTGVTFIDSCGVAALVRLWQRGKSAGVPVRISACSSSVERILRVVSLYDILSEAAEDGSR